MWIAKNNNLIVLTASTREELESQLGFIVYTSVEETDIEYQFYGGEYLTSQEIENKEWERIQALSMTRSDFFDGMIRAFGADEALLKQAIIAVLANIQIEEVEKKIAINNYDNALNFYRKHPLFTMLSNIPIPIVEGITITITGEQWDEFFDETSKGNPEAYKKLIRASN